ncbi:MAG: 4Fe-4S binding protein [Candidatus Cloacimonetes bacterium]|nr:4Fe-4S binding protein [Candidatus Cloacimonadota bacterium]
MSNIYKITIILLLMILILLFIFSSFVANKKLLSVCPTNAISMVNGRAVVEPMKCIGCGRCVFGIPNPVYLSRAKTEPDSINESPNNEIKTLVTDSTSPQEQTKAAIVKNEKQTSKPVKKKTYTVNPDTCIGCQLCIQACPVNAIQFVDGKAVIDQSKCISCGICVDGDSKDYNGCPVSAISSSK